MSIDETVVATELDENEQIALRKQKLTELRAQGNPFPNTFRRDSLAQSIHDAYENKDKETLEKEAVKVKVGGRIMTRRIMGKASFVTVQDMSGRVQLYLRGDDLPEGQYENFKNWDLLSPILMPYFLQHSL